MRQREARFFGIISGHQRGTFAAVMRGALWLVSLGYGLVMRLRAVAYRLGLKPQKSAEIPVICVGNVTAGGTGKTPMAALVVSKLRSLGANPGVLSRGYRRSDGATNDEGQWLQQQFADLPMVESADRVKGAQALLEAGADVVVMDDGFSHLRLRRDLDLVLVDATNPFGFGHLIPRGLLREPATALARAGIVGITRADQVEEVALAELQQRIAKLTCAPVFCGRHLPVSLQTLDGSVRELSWLRGERIGVMCGIANPSALVRTLEGLGAIVVSQRALDDHFAFNQAWMDREFAGVVNEARVAEAVALVVSAKDAVKLKQRKISSDHLPILELNVEMNITKGGEALHAALRKVLDAR